MMAVNLNDALRSACAQVGILYRDVPADGTFHRTDTDGDAHGKCDGTIKLFPDGEGGIVCNWKGEQQVFFVDDGRTLSESERHERDLRRAEAMRKAEAAKAGEQAEAASKAAAIWKAAKPAPVNHPYLVRKGIKSHGAKVQADGWLLIPMRDSASKLWNIERIAPEKPSDGSTDKKGLFHGKRTGCYCSIGTTKGAAALCIAEGFATGATIHEATGYPVAVAFNASNLEPVARALREKLPDLPLILCADDDAATEGNPGLTKATEAAQSVGGLLSIPDFGANRPERATDFNDMAQRFGLEAVKQVIEIARTSAMAEDQPNTGDPPAGDPTGTGWPEPLPLVAKVEPEPYPLDALPDIIRAAVKEVAEFVKCPLPLVASSALSALSLTIQAHADVRRDEILSAPASLFLLTIADSGERKSQADKMFIKPIQEYQDAQAEEAKPAWKDYKANLEAWEAKRGGIKDRIRQLAKGNKPTTGEESRLCHLEHEEPKPPRVLKLIREDATPEGLAKKLQREWPSAGVISNEAGIVFGAHGMNTENVMRNLALLNKLWDGGRYQSDRADDERGRDVRGARLTMGLMIQGTTLRAFFNQSKGLARGSGFLARFLVAWPDSTMGTRFYAEPVAGSPALSAFNRRIAELLNQTAPIDENGALTPTILPLATDAKAAWVEFHDAIERELASGGELYDVQDVASKSADNAARLAALFHVFVSENSDFSVSSIQAAEIESASRVVAWHLNESRRFFGELALPMELANAARLDTWLIAYCRREQTHLVPIAKLQQGGPVGLRSKATIDIVMRELKGAGRAQWVQAGKRKMIAVNPALLIQGSAS